MGPDGYSKSKQIDNEADGLSLAKELIRTAAICIQNFQRQQKPKPEPTRIQKYLIDFGIIEGKFLKVVFWAQNNLETIKCCVKCV